MVEEQKKKKRAGRKKPFCVRVTDETYSAVERDRKRTGKTLSTLVRKSILQDQRARQALTASNVSEKIEIETGARAKMRRRSPCALQLMMQAVTAATGGQQTKPTAGKPTGPRTRRVIHKALLRSRVGQQVLTVVRDKLNARKDAASIGTEVDAPVRVGRSATAAIKLNTQAAKLATNTKTLLKSKDPAIQRAAAEALAAIEDIGRMARALLGQHAPAAPSETLRVGQKRIQGALEDA